MANKITELQANFEKAIERKKQIKDVSRVFKDFLQSMQNELSSHGTKNSFFSCMCLKQSKLTVNPRFLHAFKELSQQQKFQYYIQSVNYAYDYQNKQKETSEPEQQSERFNIVKEGFSGQELTVRLLRYKLEIKDGGILDLRNYIMRRSSRKNCYVLESINKIEPKEFRFRFNDRMDKESYMPKIERVIKLAHQSHVIRMAFVSKNSPSSKTENMIKQLVPQIIQVKNKNDFGRLIQQEPDKALAAFISFSKAVQQKSQNQYRNKEFSTDQDKIPVQVDSVMKYSKHLIQKSQKRIQSSHINMISRKQKQTMRAVKKLIKHQNIFNKFYPNRSLNQITTLTGFRQYYSSNRNRFKILIQNINLNEIKKTPQFKISLISNLSAEVIVKSIINFQKYREWHNQIKDATIQMHLNHENSQIIQLLHHSSITKKDTLFTFLVHCFFHEGAYYIMQKEVKQEAQFMNHANQKTGRIIYGLWKVKQSKEGATNIFYETKRKHPGVLNTHQQINVMVNYLKGFEKMNQFYNDRRNNSVLLDLLVLKWYYKDNNELSQIEEEQMQLANINSGQFGDCQAISDEFMQMQSSINLSQKKQEEIILQNVQEFQTFLNKSRVSIDQCQILSQNGQRKISKRLSGIQEGQLNRQKCRQSRFFKKMNSGSNFNSSVINSPKLKRKSQYTSKMFIQPKLHFKPFKVQLNQQGRTILPNKYITHHFNLIPRGPAIYPRIQASGNNQILRNNFQFDNSGSMVLTNQKIIDAYNGVVKEMVKKIKSNFLQGKSLINISLPVTIFKDDSNSQRMLKSWAMAPYFIQQATKIANKVQRMKFAVAFGISTSAYYFDIQKVFNPILGQTFQAFVGGCPMYAQQISHHPPTLSILLIGRGYKVYGTVEAKVQIRANSAAGSNDGVISIAFDDCQKICFTNPRGEVSGLMIGKMSFRFIGTSYYYDIENRVIAEVLFEDPSGFFCSNKWKKQTQLQGRIMIVTPDFINKFIQSNYALKPQNKDIEMTVHTISGQWTGDIKFDGYSFFSFADQKPFEIVEEPNPLNSHANYRQDIIYRKANDLQRSQRQKQRLQQLQRHDRKLREKYRKIQ